MIIWHVLDSTQYLLDECPVNPSAITHIGMFSSQNTCSPDFLTLEKKLLLLTLPCSRLNSWPLGINDNTS